MTDPADETVLRDMADCYRIVSPSFAAQLRALADYLAQFTPTELPSIETDPPAGEPESLPPAIDTRCPMTWVRPSDSISGTSTSRNEVCGRPAVIAVEYDGQLYNTCPECAEETVKMGGRRIGDRRD